MVKFIGICSDVILENDKCKCGTCHGKCIIKNKYSREFQDKYRPWILKDLDMIEDSYFRISTESNKVVKIANKKKIKVFFKRSKKLCKRNVSKLDVWKDAIKKGNMSNEYKTQKRNIFSIVRNTFLFFPIFKFSC